MAEIRMRGDMYELWKVSVKVPKHGIVSTRLLSNGMVGVTIRVRWWGWPVEAWRLLRNRVRVIRADWQESAYVEIVSYWTPEGGEGSWGFFSVKQRGSFLQVSLDDAKSYIETRERLQKIVRGGGELEYTVCALNRWGRVCYALGWRG